MAILRSLRTARACRSGSFFVVPRPIYAYLDACHQRGRNSRGYAMKQSDPLKILFYGSDNFSCASLSALVAEKETNPGLIESIEVVVRPGKPFGRGLKMKREVPLQKLAEKLALVVHERDTNTGWTPNFPYNLIVAVSFGLMIPARLIRAAKYGGLNLHPSMLPDLRGAAPLHHTLLQNRTHIGVSLQTLHETSFDHGLILAQTPAPGLSIPEDCTLDELHELVTPIAADMLATGLRTGIHVAPQQSVGWVPPADYKLLEARRLEKRDLRIDWKSWTAQEVVQRRKVLGPLWTHFRSPSGALTRVQFTEVDWSAQRKPLLDAGKKDFENLGPVELISVNEDEGTESVSLVRPLGFTEDESVVLQMRCGGYLKVRQIKLAGKGQPTSALLGFRGLYTETKDDWRKLNNQKLAC
ncbi:hypothetical protein BROUX41_000250 [Berkeleyomyces rouxiae]|uniref:uncharacterized protein n=1 Tax=Berkeleyomyces rouxiae TaxID=2035830 RepID=UPI003B7F7232